LELFINITIFLENLKILFQEQNSLMYLAYRSWFLCRYNVKLMAKKLYYKRLVTIKKQKRIIAIIQKKNVCSFIRLCTVVTKWCLGGWLQGKLVLFLSPRALASNGSFINHNFSILFLIYMKFKPKIHMLVLDIR